MVQVKIVYMLKHAVSLFLSWTVQRVMPVCLLDCCAEHKCHMVHVWRLGFGLVCKTCTGCHSSLVAHPKVDRSV